VNENEAVAETLPAPVWQWLDRDRYCTSCSKEIEAGSKVLFFPFTQSIYCRRCARLFSNKWKEETHRRSKRGEYMPPA